jgi:hypothetical protein
MFVICSKNAVADRKFFRDVLKFTLLKSGVGRDPRSKVYKGNKVESYGTFSDVTLDNFFRLRRGEELSQCPRYFVSKYYVRMPF